MPDLMDLGIVIGMGFGALIGILLISLANLPVIVGMFVGLGFTFSCMFLFSRKLSQKEKVQIK